MKTLIASILILSSINASASEPGAAAEVKGPGAEACLVRDLSLAQKTEIKKMSDEANEKLRPLIAELKLSRDLLNRIMQNPQALKADAVNAKASIAARSLEIKAIQSEKNVTESFDILSPEQRVKKARCLASLRNPRSHEQQGRVIVQRPVRRPYYSPAPYLRYGNRFPHVGRRVYPSPAGRYPRRIFP